MPTQQKEQPTVDKRLRDPVGGRATSTKDPSQMTDAEFDAWRREQHNTFTRYVKRLSAFRNYVRRELRRDPTGDRDRDLASQRAMSAIWSLSWVLHTLADENALQEHVKKAIRAADAAYRAASLKGELPEPHAAMQLVVAIRDAASEVLSGDLSIEDVRFRREFFGSDFFTFPGSSVSVDHHAFREAVRAWVVSEQAMNQGGKRKGRTPDRWRPTLKCLERFGLQNGIKSEKSLKDRFAQARPHVLPLGK